MMDTLLEVLYFTPWVLTNTYGKEKYFVENLERILSYKICSVILSALRDDERNINEEILRISKGTLCRSKVCYRAKLKENYEFMLSGVSGKERYIICRPIGKYFMLGVTTLPSILILILEPCTFVSGRTGPV